MFPFNRAFLINVAGAMGIKVSLRTIIYPISTPQLICPVMEPGGLSFGMEIIKLEHKIKLGPPNPSGTLWFGYGEKSDTLAVRWDNFGQTNFLGVLEDEN